MMRNVLAVLAVVSFATVLTTLPAHAATCDSLRALKLPNAVIAAAQLVGAGKFLPPGTKAGEPAVAVYRNLPSFCRVTGVIQPTSDSHIEFEVWLPGSGWNHKFMGVGNGGSGGSITYDGTTVGTNASGLAQALKDGFATASTDTGHQGRVDDFSFGANREKLIDYYYRAIHETAVTAKAVIRAFYGTAPAYSYFSSCSRGGAQGLIEVQRYPEDYDGVLAGSPVYSRGRFLSTFVWVAQAFSAEPGSHIPETKFPAIEAAAVAACDTLDGVKDGMINDPTKCRFDSEVLLCKGSESQRCLTQQQVTALKKFYDGPRNSKGERIAPGFPPGAEACVAGSSTCEGRSSEEMASGAARRAATYDPLLSSPFNVRTFSFDRDVAALDRDLSPGDAAETNLKPFKARGGKLIIEHGWSDGTSSPFATVDYYNRVVSAMGQEATEDFLTLYMAPGVHHCGAEPGANGQAPNSYRQPMTAALQRWVETGTAPGPIVATRHKVNGDPTSGVARTRVLCPYPQVAVYKGSGSNDDARNFSCKVP